MDSLLTKQRIHVAADRDRVLLHIGRLCIEMPYAAAFPVAQHLRLSAKQAMRLCREPMANWRDHAALNDMPERTVPYQVSDVERVSIRGNFNWATGWDGEDVKAVFGNNMARFHFVVALKISEWLRDAGKEARAWAGDRSTVRLASSVLSDAEENYRLGLE